MNPEDRPVQFRTVMYLYILLGVVVALTIHFILLSTPAYNWLSGTGVA
jgi:hypothetical protein